MNLKKRQMIGIGVVAILLVLFLLFGGHRPEFFDIFGLVIFIFLIGVGFYLMKKTKIPNWIGFALILIGIVGLIVDGYLVTKAFILGG